MSSRVSNAIASTQPLPFLPFLGIAACVNDIDRLFREGGIHWGRIITLLCFGYRLAITYLRRGVVGFFANIISWVVKFVVSERIAQWIADQGGWVCFPIST